MFDHFLLNQKEDLLQMSYFNHNPVPYSSYYDNNNNNNKTHYLQMDYGTQIPAQMAVPQEDFMMAQYLPDIQNNGDIIRPIMSKGQEIIPVNSISSSVAPFQPGTTLLAGAGINWNDENADAGEEVDEEEEDDEDNEEESEEADEADKRKRKKQKQRREERPSQCVVCGKPAYCCHFDVPSCLGKQTGIINFYDHLHKLFPY
jgi:hypothetical protein